MAGAGPQGLNLQGLDLSGLGGVSGGPQQGQFGYAAQYVPGAELQRQIDVNELPQAPINAGMTAQQAILSRLSPQLTGERQQLQTQLINQGLRPGGEAYNAAMMGQAQKENDLMLQAAAQGISIDQAARQQAFNEQQSRAMFANQAALSGFGMGMEQAGLYNTGLGQNLQNALATQAAQNQAQQQAFQQRLQTGEFGREAQLASFGTQQQAQQAQNQAIAQNFQQQLAAQEAQNQAQQQAYAQQLGTAGFNREALLSQFGMGQQAQEAANQAIAQNYQQALAQQQAENAARQQIFQQSVAQQELGNQALAQRQGAVMDYFGALNAAQQQAYQQALAQAQFRNTAAQQALAQQAAIRSIPVNEISALMSGGQVSVPQFQGYSGVTVAPAPIFQGGQAQDAAAMQRYGIAANQAASNTSGLFGLAGQIGSAALLASDRRLKSNIVRIGTHPLGIGIYEYDIFGERQRGVMAQELEQVMPEAVVEHPAGFKMVNYALL
jgi:chemotaxis protein histidine kinase CheA